MDTHIAATEEGDARAAANQLKAGNGAEFGQSLAKEYLEMGRNRHDFQQFMDIVARDIARATTSCLPLNLARMVRATTGHP